jgi:hypothetical protein
VCAAAASLASCGSGLHSASVPQPAATATTAPYTGPLAGATFTITIPPPPKPNSTRRRPNYVSSSTSKVVFTLNTSSILTAGQVTSFNAGNLGTFAVTLGSATCPGSGPWTCTLTIKLPPGSDNLTISAQDSSSNILSQQIQTFTVTAGGSAAGANHFSTTLDANASTMTIGAASGFCAGSFNVGSGQTVPTVGTAALTFNATYTDLAGKTIIAPGRPILSVNGHTDDNGGAGYTITGTGGNATVKVNQSTQSYTLAATTTNTTATISVAATPANTNTSSDGLGFNKTLSYTFQSGPAPPSSFLAVIEQTGSNTGKVDFFTINTSNDTFSTFSPATLTSTNPGAGPDVDFPQDMLFDSNGDLLIANGGAGNPDFGNFACIPAGAVTTGANAATVLTTNMDDPTFLAFGSDGTVALANTPGSAGVHMDEFVLNGTYAAAATTRDITNTDYPGLGATGVVALPTSAQNPAGSFAASITNGRTVSHIVIKHPDGTTQQIDDANVVDPVLAFDPNSVQIVAANGNDTGPSGGPHFYYLTFFSTTGTKQKQILIQDSNCYSAGAYTHCPPSTPGGPSNMKASVVAASSSGYVAVGGITASGEPEVQVYDNTASRLPVGGPIPYDATTTPGGATFVYGNATIIVSALRFITPTKLLVSLQSDNAAKQGIYIYDVGTLAPSCSPCYDPNANQFPNSPKQTGFQQLGNSPLSVAYKP